MSGREARSDSSVPLAPQDWYEEWSFKKKTKCGDKVNFQTNPHSQIASPSLLWIRLTPLQEEEGTRGRFRVRVGGGAGRGNGTKNFAPEKPGGGCGTQGALEGLRGRGWGVGCLERKFRPDGRPHQESGGVKKRKTCRSDRCRTTRILERRKESWSVKPPRTRNSSPGWKGSPPDLKVRPQGKWRNPLNLGTS